VELFLRDEASRLKTPSKRTGLIPKKRNPIWNQEFTFAVKRTTAALTLHLEVWDHDAEREDYSLGKASLALTPDLLQQASSTRQVRDLPLSDNVEIMNLPIGGRTGSIRVEIGWEPDGMKLTGAGDTVTIWKMIASPPVLRLTAIAMSGLAGLLMVVATAARWLCTAEGEQSYKVVIVPATAACCVMAATLQIMVFFLHFLGAAGIITSENEGWGHMPPTLMSLAESGLDERCTQGLVDHSQEFTIEATIKPEVQLGGFQMGVNLSFCPRLKMSAARVFTWLLQGAALALSCLAWLLAWLEDGPSSFIAEGAYIDGFAVALMLLSILLFRRADLQQDNLEKWVYHQTPKGADSSSSLPGAMRFPNFGAPNQLEDFQANLRVQMERQRELFEERMRDFQGKISEGPSKMQENLSMLQEAAQPLLQTLKRGSVGSPNAEQPSPRDPGQSAVSQHFPSTPEAVRAVQQPQPQQLQPPDGPMAAGHAEIEDHQVVHQGGSRLFCGC
jgi:hypothetical protein